MEHQDERRLAANRALESRINVGIAYKHALGAAVARTFYLSQAIPGAIVARLLDSDERRRPALADTLIMGRLGGLAGDRRGDLA